MKLGQACRLDDTCRTSQQLKSYSLLVPSRMLLLCRYVIGAASEKPFCPECKRRPFYFPQQSHGNEFLEETIFFPLFFFHQKCFFLRSSCGNSNLITRILKYTSLVLTKRIARLRNVR